MDDLENSKVEVSQESFEEMEEELLYLRECCKIFSKEFYKPDKHINKYHNRDKSDVRFDSKFIDGYKTAWADAQTVFHSTFSKDLYQKNKSFFSRFDDLQDKYQSLRKKYNGLLLVLKSKTSFIHGQTVRVLIPYLNKVNGTVISVNELEQRLTVSYVDENINRSVQIVCLFDEVEKI